MPPAEQCWPSSNHDTPYQSPSNLQQNPMHRWAPLGRHVLSAAGGYMIWMCEVLALPDPGIRSAPDAATLVRDADHYMEHVLEQWRAALRELSDERLETPEYPSQWRTRYCIDSMLEHAVMHPIRHAFQLDELLKDL